MTTSGLAAAILHWRLPVAPGSFKYSAFQFLDSESMGLAIEIYILCSLQGEISTG